MIHPVLLIAIPLFLAFLTPIVGIGSKKYARYMAPLAAGLNTLVSIFVLFETFNGPVFDILSGFSPPLGIVLMVGPLGALIALLISFTSFVVSLNCLKYPKEPVVKYTMLYILLMMGATGMVITGDLFNLFVFMEITSIASYGLASFNRDKRGYLGAIKYVVVGSIGSTFVLVGIGLIYAQLRTLNMLDISARLSQMNSFTAIVAFVSLFVGLSVEAEIFPLNTWVPDAYRGAPSQISAVFASVAAKAGIFAIARIIFTIFGYSNYLWFVVILGMLTVIIGEFSAYVERDLKKMLAYSSIAQMGMIVLGFGIGTVLALQGAFFQMLSHAIAKAVLFMAAGYFVYRTGTTKMESIRGLGRNPLIGIPLTISVLSIMGLPLFLGFYGKFYIVLAGIDAGYYAIIALILLASVVEVAYYARFLKIVFDKSAEPKEVTPGDYVPMMILAVVLVIFGVYPYPILDVLSHVASFLAGGV